MMEKKLKEIEREMKSMDKDVDLMNSNMWKMYDECELLTKKNESIQAQNKKLVDGFKEIIDYFDGDSDDSIQIGDLIPFVENIIQGISNNTFSENRNALLENQNKKLVECLEFYADPGTYFAIGFFPDPPNGDFMNDFSETSELGMKPGKMARELIDELFKEVE